MHSKPYTTVSLNQISVLPGSEIPKKINAIPSMMSLPEKALLYSLAKNHYQGKGLIVDAGIFLGASTLSFATGLKNQNLAPDKQIHSFDLALVSPGMMNFFKRKNIHSHLSIDQPIASLIEKGLDGYADYVELRYGDILNECWESGRKIELMFLDILKTRQINQYVVGTFFEQLIPGKSFVIQQDYFYHRLPYIKIHQEFFADYFQYCGMCRTSAIFKYTKKIPKEMLQIDPYKELSLDELVALHNLAQARANIDIGRAMMMDLSLCELYYDLNQIDLAKRHFMEIKGKYADFIESDLKKHNRIILSWFENMFNN